MVELLRCMDLLIVIPQKPTNNQILKVKNGSEVLDAILKTNVGIKFNLDDEIVQKKDKKLFDQMCKRHKSMKYAKYFQWKMTTSERNDHRSSQEKHFDCQVQPIAKIGEAFQTILYRVISKELIGNNRNKKKILKTLMKILKTAEEEPFVLSNLIKSINISSISWINSINNNSQRYILLAKFIKWLFQYFITLIRCYFHIDYIKDKRIFITKKDWINQTTKYINKMYSKSIVVCLLKNIDIKEINNKLVLLPKSNNFRPVLKKINRQTEEEKDKLKQMKGILQHLYNIHFVDTKERFDNKYIQLVKGENFTNTKTYLIKSDITNAYGSIMLGKLSKILEEMFEALPDKIQLKSTMKYNKKQYKYKEPTEKTNYSVTYLGKNEILEAIKREIFETKFVFNKKVYLLCKGVGQGLKLSPLFNKIYYAFMRKKYFSDFQKHGHLFSYVDDSLFITKDLTCAENYLKIIKNGIPEYNCWFHKIEENINMISNNENEQELIIKFLGWKINSTTLEVGIEFETPRYTLDYKRLNYSSMQGKILNLSALKLNKLIFDKKINSEIQIIRNIKEVAHHYANRCFYLCSCMRSDDYVFPIKTIKLANKKILKAIEHCSEWSKDSQSFNRNRIKYFLWKFLYQVFSSKRNKYSREIEVFNDKKKMYVKKFIKC